VVAETTTKSQKRERGVQCPELESALLEWFFNYERDGAISGELIREKPKLLYKLIYPTGGVPVLEFSNWLLDGLKTSHGIRQFNRHRESGSADMNAIAQQRPEIIKLLASYEYKDIYNMDKTGMYSLF